jgi:hypothetical protein
MQDIATSSDLTGPVTTFILNCKIINLNVFCAWSGFDT